MARTEGHTKECECLDCEGAREELQLIGTRWDDDGKPRAPREEPVGELKLKPTPFVYPDFDRVQEKDRDSALVEVVDRQGKPIGRAKVDPKPYKCPVCEGRGMMPIGFYSSLQDMPDGCRSCAGKGVVWDE